MPADLTKLKQLFLAAVKLPAAERAAYLHTACAGDTAMRQEVEVMLQSHENSGELLPRTPGELLQDNASTEADATAAFQPQVHGSATHVDASQVNDHDLGFLTPSSKPGCLGTLGRYEIQEVLGKGGFGVVLKAYDERLHRVVAVKVLSPAYAANGAARKRFIREAQTGAAIKNEHVVAIYDVEKEEQPPFLAMEFVEGVSLQDKLDKNGSLSVKEILRIGLQISEGLAAAHKQGLVHRDIKPANILLENGVERVKITDFGLARAVDDASVTQSGTVAGTPMYMSPEQAEGLPIDHRSDLFSLGTVLYAMCTGHPPFRASGTHAVLKRVIDASPRPIREINNEIPEWLCDIIGKLHAKKPEDRFQTAKEVAELLGQHLAHLQQPHVAPRPAPVNVVAATPTSESELVLPVLSALGAGFRIYCVFVVTIGAFLTLGMWLFGWRGMTVVRVLFPVFVFLTIASWGLSTWATRSNRPRWGSALWQAAATLGAFAFGLGMAIVFEWISPLPEPIDPLNGKSFVPVFGGPGWRQLCDGKSYTGWKTFGNSNAGRGEFLLFPAGGVETVESWPRIFNLRMEVLLVHGQGTVRFHTSSRGQNEPQDGWWLSFTEESDGKINAELSAFNPDDAKDVNEFPALNVAKCGEWFHVEIIANQHRTDVRINGRETMELKHANNVPVAGVLRLLNNGRRNIDGKGQDSQIAFRNIEIKSHLLKDSTESGWVQLFNGKDLEGWDVGPKLAWLVRDGGLVAKGKSDPKAEIGPREHENYALWTKKEYENYELRVRFKFTAAKGPESAFVFVHASGDPGDRQHIDVGLLNNAAPILSKRYAATLGRHTTDPVPAPTPGAWNDLRIVCQDKKVTVIFNGKHCQTASDCSPFRGRLGLYLPHYEVEFKKIEIKELPSAEPGWVQLFNGKDLTGWRPPYGNGDWRVVDNVLIGKTDKGAGSLPSLRSDYANFHLRAEVRLKGPGHSGIFFRNLKGYDLLVEDKFTGSFAQAEPWKFIAQKQHELVEPESWFTLELVAQGPNLTSKVNGQVVASIIDTSKATGFFELEVYAKKGPVVVEFRKIEIKELPPEPPEISVADTPRKIIDNKDLVFALAFLGDGASLLAGGKYLTFYDSANGEELQREELPSRVSAPFSLSKDGKTVALAHEKAAMILDLPVRKLPLPSQYAFSLALSPDGKSLVYSANQKLWFHDRSAGKAEEFDAGKLNHGGIMFSPDGRYLVSTRDRTLTVRDAKTREIIAEIEIGSPGMVDISKDSKLIAATGQSGGKGNLHVFTLPDLQKVYTQVSLPTPLSSIALSPDGNYLALGQFNGAAQIWRFRDNKLIATLNTGSGLYTAVAFSPDGKTLATATGNTIKLWDLAAEPGWVQLFNGKDLAGWTAHAPWKVWKWENDTLVARTAAAAPLDWARLESARIVKDFELRFQARVLDGEFELRLRKNGTGFTPITFGNFGWGKIAQRDAAPLSDANKAALQQAYKSVRQDEYNDVALTCIGARFIVKINGVTAYDGEPGHGLTQGSVEWVVPINMSKVDIRKAEIREMRPPSESGWVQLFNGTDLKGWDGHKKHWRWKDGSLRFDNPSGTAVQTTQNLWSTKTYRDFELKFAAKVLDGRANLLFRATVDDEKPTVTGPFATLTHAKSGVAPGQLNHGQGATLQIDPDTLAKVRKSLKDDDYNSWYVRCQGKRITIKVNGITTVDTAFENVPDAGVVCFQIQANAQIDGLAVKEVEIKELPEH